MMPISRSTKQALARAVRVRNPAVRGTVAPIEVADREIKPKAEPKAPVKAEAKTETKAETKSTVKAADTRTK